MIFFISLTFLEVILSAFSPPSSKILSIKLLSFFNLFISYDIGEIFSTTRSESFCLNSEKFFPPNSFIESDSV